MGQQIEIAVPTVIDDVAVFDTDRSLSGQDGESFGRADSDASTFPAQLAQRVFEADATADHVFVFSNTISIRRREGWSDEALGAAHQVIADFFVFYDENKSP